MELYVFFNCNPLSVHVGDCTVRAIAKVLAKTWEKVYLDLCATGLQMADMPSANSVWGAYLRKNGFRRDVVDDHGRDRYTVRDFCADHPEGRYVLALNGHVVAAINGQYFDSWDSGDEVPVYCWYCPDCKKEG